MNQRELDEAFFTAWMNAKDEGINARELAERLGYSSVRAVKTKRSRVESRLGTKLPALAESGGYRPRQLPGFVAHATSTLIKPDGSIALQWVKERADPAQEAERNKAAAEAFAAELPKLSPIRAERKHNKRLMACYPIGDAHIGMRSWHEETGEDWDLSIAEHIQCGAMRKLVESAPEAESATIVNLGDWFHYDSMEPVTQRSGNVLDVDSRYAKMVRVGVMVMRQCIESALEKHKRVRVINAIGNHDDTGAIWLSVCLSHFYERNKRVIIEQSPAAFNYFRFGKCLVGIHHGHSCKADKLPGVMAADRPKDWGEAEHRFWWLGHFHHQAVREFPGVTVETFGTLAARDAYAAAGGWRSRRYMQCIVLHDEFGEVARHTVRPEMIE